MSSSESLGGVTIETLLKVPLVFVDSIADKRIVNIVVINEDKVGRKKWTANNLKVVCEGLNLVSVILVHELTDW